MPLSPVEIEALVLANARALALPLAPEHVPGVLQYFALAAQMAELVEGLPLTPADESGSVFAAVAPSGVSNA